MGAREGFPNVGDQVGRDGKKDRRIERGCRPAGEVVGTIAVTTLVAWYTLLMVHTHSLSLCLPRFSLFLFVSVPHADYLSTPSARTCVSCRCTHAVHTREARILLPAIARLSRVRLCACSLASLFFFRLSRAARRRELAFPPPTLVCVSRPPAKAHTATGRSTR